MAKAYIDREKLIEYMISEYRKLATMVDFRYAQGYLEAISTVRKFDCEIVEEKSWTTYPNSNTRLK